MQTWIDFVFESEQKYCVHIEAWSYISIYHSTCENKWNYLMMSLKACEWIYYSITAQAHFQNRKYCKNLMQASFAGTHRSLKDACIKDQSNPRFWTKKGIKCFYSSMETIFILYV